MELFPRVIFFSPLEIINSTTSLKIRTPKKTEIMTHLHWNSNPASVGKQKHKRGDITAGERYENGTPVQTLDSQRNKNQSVFLVRNQDYTMSIIICFPLTKVLKGNLKSLVLAAVSLDLKGRSWAFNRQLKAVFRLEPMLKGNFQEQKHRVETHRKTYTANSSRTPEGNMYHSQQVLQLPLQSSSLLPVFFIAQERVGKAVKLGRHMQGLSPATLDSKAQLFCCVETWSWA